MSPARALRWAALVAVAMALLWWSAVIGKPLRNDQVIFESAALGILQHGYPLIEYGKGFVNLGLWHPPLFFYEQALFTLASGSAEVGARLPGLVGLLLAVGLALSSLKRWGLREEAWGFLFLIFASAQVLAPSAIPDHDGSLVLPASVALALLLLDSLRRDVPVPTLAATALVFLALWGKLTTPPLLFLAWIAAWAFIRGLRRGLLEAGVPVAVGTALFGLSFLAYSAAFHLNPLFTVEYMSWAKLSSAAPLLVRLRSLLEGLWVLGPPLLLLLGIGVVSGPKEPWRRQGAALLVALALAPLVAFSLLSPYLSTHPFTWKYLLPSRAFLALAIVMLWPRQAVQEAFSGKALRLAGLALVLLLAGLLVVRNYLGFRALAPLGALLLGIPIACRGQPRAAWAGRLASLAFSVLAAEALFFGAYQLGQSASSPIEFNTGERGFSQVVEELKDPKYKGALFLCRKDVGFYTPGRNAVPIDPHFRLDPRVPIEIPFASRPFAQAFAGHWPFPVKDWTIYASYERAYVNDLGPLKAYLEQDVDWVIDSNYDSFLRENAVRDLVNEHFERQTAAFGDYAFYRRKGPKPKKPHAGA